MYDGKEISLGGPYPLFGRMGGVLQELPARVLGITFDSACERIPLD
jgi:hypothetical protein